MKMAGFIPSLACLVLGASTARADDEASAVKMLQKLGAKVVVDKELPGAPVVEVDLIRTNVDDDMLQVLAPLKHLRTLSLFGRKISGIGLRDLAHLGELKSLDLSRSQVTDEGLKVVSQFESLEVLKLETAEHITLAGIEYLAALKNLRTLDLQVTGATAAWAKQISSFPQLQNVDLRENPIGDAGIESIVKLLDLRGLGLDGTDITDKGVRRLTVLTKLERLELSDNYITDESVVPLLAGLSELRSVRLSRTPVTPKVLDALPRLRHLEELHLPEFPLSEASAQLLVPHSQLRVLWASDASDRSLEILSEMTSLRDLLVAPAERVTDAGIAHLAKMKNLESVHVWRIPKVNEPALEQLRKALPKTLVDIAVGQ